jgi:hypothetical protein
VRREKKGKGARAHLMQVQVKNQVFWSLVLLCGRVRKVEGR